MSTEKDKTLKELFAEYGQSLTDSWGRETLLVDYQRFKALMIERLEQKRQNECIECIQLFKSTQCEDFKTISKTDCPLIYFINDLLKELSL